MKTNRMSKYPDRGSDINCDNINIVEETFGVLC
jgi:hypothetical protein